MVTPSPPLVNIQRRGDTAQFRRRRRSISAESLLNSAGFGALARRYIHNLLSGLFPVIYTNERNSVLEQFIQDFESPIISDEVLWPIYKYGLLAKSLDWRYQNEWRLLSLDKMLADKSDDNCSFMPISKVYLGAKMKDDEERRKIAKICDEKGIPVTCVMPKQDEFIMQDCLRKPGCLLEKN